MQDYYAPVKLPLNIWDKYSIRPGPTGSVGDTLTQVRLKQSAPELRPRYLQWSSNEMMKFHGTNIQDGRHKSFMSLGANAKVYQKRLPFKPGYKTQQGWVHQDIVPVHRQRETLMAGFPQFGWKSQVASVLRAKVSGEGFLPVPEGYKSTEMTRGGQYPKVIDKVANMEPLPSATKYTEKAKSGLSKIQQNLLLENKPVTMNDLVDRLTPKLSVQPTTKKSSIGGMPSRRSSLLSQRMGSLSQILGRPSRDMDVESYPYERDSI